MTEEESSRAWRTEDRKEGWAVRVAAVQAGYYIITGVMPFVSMRAFEAVTGLKVDKWLVKTVGALVTVVGGSLGLAAAKRRVTPEIIGLGLGSAAALGGVSLVYALKGRISKVYLLDAALELGLIIAWAAAPSEETEGSIAGP